jgi:hypothetical protein
LNYLTDRRRAAYVDALDSVGARRDLSWVFAESPVQAPGLPYPGDRPVHDDLTQVVLVTWRGGRRTARHLATAHPHGRWVHWVGSGPAEQS